MKHKKATAEYLDAMESMDKARSMIENMPADWVIYYSEEHETVLDRRQLDLFKVCHG